jgi:alanyl-tRNA synthetase
MSHATAAEIRRRFLEFFERHEHAVRPSASLVPADDPTLLFTNAGMVPFKRLFLGLEAPAFGRRATTSQKCVRAGGKHNDLEQVGHTYRHHTFFEMLGNFSFGDYFKRDAITFAWEFVTRDLGLPREHLYITVYRSDDEARALWREIAGVPDSRIYGLGEADNFWQMGDTGPCGPCSEIYIDLAHVAADWRFPPGATGEWTDVTRTTFSEAAFVEGAEAGRFLEFWNLVFMQFDRQADGTLLPLPRPSVDTGAGLERISAVLAGVTSNYHTDLFGPLIAAVETAVGRPYRGREGDAVVAVPGGIGRQVVDDPAAYRVLADHARAVAFLLADGVFPASDGRGYVLRRILRRAVRHAWLLGRDQPTLVHVVQAVIDTMGDVYPELCLRARHLLDTTRAEEERFLETIADGMARFDEIAPAPPGTHGSTALRGTISGADAFQLYDTYGFPFDLTELMARERSYAVDVAGFESALATQRTRSQDERKSRKLGVSADELADLSTWEIGGELPSPGAEFVGYTDLDVQTTVAAKRDLADGRSAVILDRRPFYLESGGQVSDRGEVIGDGWRMDVEDLRRTDGRVAAIGRITGEFRFGDVEARVPADTRRDTERNHTATHLLHAALRTVLGEHVHQRGSLVAPDRLRFDFSHTGPMRPEQLAEVEVIVNREIWRAAPVERAERPYREAVAAGAMALFGEKYGDVVRVITVPGFSMELCGGTHVRNTAEIALFKIVAETGVGGGTRRIEAVTGPGAYERTRRFERAADRVAELLKTAPDPDVVVTRVEQLIGERRALEKRLLEAERHGGAGATALQALLAGASDIDGVRVVAATVAAADLRALQAMGDAVREQSPSTVAALAASFADGKQTLLIVVSDDLRARGLRADQIVGKLAAIAGGRGGGKPHMAQAGIPDGARLPAALDAVTATVRDMLAAGGSA